ncbi:MAG: AraC family transcriptional regulator [Chitinophagaceae bacterium]|nr:MAG: AraC family transcriptional regulator [Chitinophagaceae bacterium]
MSVSDPYSQEIMLPCITDKMFRIELLLEDHYFGRIISGEVKMVVADRTITLNAGETFFCPRNQLATFIKLPKDGQPYKSVMILLKTERLKAYYSRHDSMPGEGNNAGFRFFADHPLLDSLFGSLLPYFGYDGDIPAPVIAVKIEEAITVLRTLDKRIDSVLANFSEPGKIDLVDFMEKNFMFNMPLQKFAYMTGRSLTTFKTDFRKSFHTSPQRWLTRKRLELANYQLREQQRKPVDVYLEAGFENLSHFSFAFKKHFGYGPRDVISS